MVLSSGSTVFVSVNVGVLGPETTDQLPDSDSGFSKSLGVIVVLVTAQITWSPPWITASVAGIPTSILTVSAVVPIPQLPKSTIHSNT